MKVDVAAKTGTPSWVLAVVATPFALVMAYAVWSAIGNLSQAIIAGQDAGLSLSMLGWVSWIFAMIMPLALFAGAFMLGRRRPLGHFTLLMLVAVGLTAVVWINVVAYTASSTATMYTV